MTWLLQHWQTLATVAIVAVTVAVFARRLLRPRKRSGCGHDCGCGIKK